jgi:hypothetical protein
MKLINASSISVPYQAQLDKGKSEKEWAKCRMQELIPPPIKAALNEKEGIK